MTFEEYWIGLCDKNPALRKKSLVRIKTDNLKGIAEQAYLHGKKNGTETPKAVSDLFGGLFR